MNQYAYEANAEMKPDDYEKKNDTVTHVRVKKSGPHSKVKGRHDNGEYHAEGFAGGDLDNTKMNFDWRSGTVGVDEHKKYGKNFSP